ncbi:protein ninH [Providencia rettgeri]|uniref:protein ninH n=1 Tax=Providencia rettgeri TaxID=587 RepID=UPI0018E40F4D|nr:protein ninH [Providencia rettgeri]MBI6188679.1 protein ninH [Providencia rettgeri]
MQTEITTIPALLVKMHGNMSEVARQLNCNRATVRKYSGDICGLDHAIINGRLMTKYKHAKGAK